VHENFEERNGEPTNEGDPTDPAVKSFNFSEAVHRPSSGITRQSPSEVLVVKQLVGKNAEDVHEGFVAMGFVPVGVEVTDDGTSFLAIFESVEVGVKALIACHAKLCGDEDATIIFARTRIEKDTARSTNNANEDGDGAAPANTTEEAAAPTTEGVTTAED
jgi:hypothetical protein